MTYAVAMTYLDALRHLSTADQGRAQGFLQKFRRDPNHSGFDLKKPEGARDPNAWSARVTDDLRAILYRKGDLTVFMHVDRHDPAYSWATSHIFTRDTLTGALQIVDAPESVEVPETTFAREPSACQPPPLFDDCADDYLLSVGLPAPWLPTIRRVRSTDSLYGFLGKLPEEIIERLLDLADGKPVPPAPPTPEPTAPANASAVPSVFAPDALRRFFVLDGDEDLMNVLQAPMARWIAFLHPSQRAVAHGSFRGPVKVSGSAGTGKTVVAMHRARHLARQGKRVLLTSYVNTLCRNIERNLDLFCGPEDGRRITVRTILSAARQIVVKADGPTELMLDHDVRALVRHARLSQRCPFSEAFLWAEWEGVIAAQGLNVWAEYRGADRSGRGKALSVRDRKTAWDVFEQVFAAMEARNARDAAGMCRRATDILREGAVDRPYDAVIVDEAQDCTPRQIAFVAALAGDGPDALTLTGDGGQRIYSRGFSLRKMGIETRGRSHILRLNYRTTEQIRRAADQVLGTEVDDLDGGREARTGTRSLMRGPAPSRLGFATPEEQDTFVERTIRTYLDAGLTPGEIAVFARSNSGLDALETHLKSAGLPCHRLDEKSDPPDNALILGTMHRAKGLEFKVVFVVNASQNVLPNVAALRGLEDPLEIQAAQERERQVLYVSMTRARDELYITWVGRPSPFLADAG